MIYAIEAALSALESELEQFIPDNDDSDLPLGNDAVVLGNIAQLDAAAGNAQSNLENHIVISLVNIEEESALKNRLNFRKSPATGTVTYENPPVYLNLYVLFCANFPSNYLQSLRALSLVIRFFQGHSKFQFRLSDPQGAEEDEMIEMTLDLYTLTFEQINHLWGSLGGKQVPFVLYKVRLVSITDHRITGTGRLIEKIEGNAKVINPKVK
jgi:Pvc16 N-terminal domain